MKKPHKHAELIKAWADGAEIQFLAVSNGAWTDSKWPSWEDDLIYRIKPEPKPDVVLFGAIRDSGVATVFTPTQGYFDNVKATFDGDTQKLKSLEVLK